MLQSLRDLCSFILTIDQFNFRNGNPSLVAAADERIAQVDTHVYYLDQAARQLHHYDGWLNDLSLTDNAVGLEFRYFGDPNPPLSPRPPLGRSLLRLPLRYTHAWL
jgi:hypothetical protein